MRQRRFVRGRDAGGAKVGKRSEPRGKFLGRMWALFGRPMQVTERGFSYTVHDRDTGLEFAAASEDGGSIYRGASKDAKQLRPVLVAFEALLDKTPAAECRLELPAGDGKVLVIGMKNGAPFEELVAAPLPGATDAR